MGGVLAGPPAVARAVDGRDMVFARQADGGVYFSLQSTSGASLLKTT